MEAAAVSNGLPATDVTCCSGDTVTVSKVLSCACALFGVDVGIWRLFKDAAAAARRYTGILLHIGSAISVLKGIAFAGIVVFSLP